MIVTEEEELKQKDRDLYECENEAHALTDGFTDPDWRKSRRDHILPNTSFRARFYTRGKNGQANTDWRHAQVAAKHLKFCPGEKCRVWLPLYHFGSNYNMPDALDIYCIGCNTSKRNEKRGKRNEDKVVTDKFVEFKKEFDTDEFNSTRTREVAKRIDMAAVEAKGRFKREIPIKTQDVCKRLFDEKKYKCTVTNDVLTPKCFLDHHTVTFEVRENAHNKKVLDVICSECVLFVAASQ